MRLALIWRKTKLPSSSSSSSSHPYSCRLNPLWSKTKGIQAPENAECLAEEVGLQFSLLRSQHVEEQRLKSFLTQRGNQSDEKATAPLDNDIRPCYRKSVIKQNRIHCIENGFILLSDFLLLVNYRQSSQEFITRSLPFYSAWLPTQVGAVLKWNAHLFWSPELALAGLLAGFSKAHTLWL